MSKHTCGPWSIKREGADINIVSEQVPYVAQVFPCPSVDVDHNARLIAVAPELLEALQDIAYWAESQNAEAMLPAILTAANRAIAKATGETP